MTKLYILGVGRSGTGAMAAILNAADNVHIAHEAVVYPWIHWRNMIYNNQPLPVTDPPFTWMNKVNKDIVGDSNGFLKPFAKLIHKMDKTIKFIHLWREPQKVIASRMGIEHIMNDAWKDSIQESGHWRPFGPEVTDRFTRICMHWVAANERLHQDLIGTDHKLIKLENIIKELPMLYEWLDIKGDINKSIEQCYIKHNKRDNNFVWEDKHTKICDNIVNNSEWYKSVKD